MSSFDEVVAALKAGKPALFPTDTVVGLGVAVAFCESPHVLFDLKGRPSGKPVAWLVDGVAALDEYGCVVPQTARQAVADGWPGALTAIVKASDAVPVAFQSQTGTIGLRMPNAPEVLDLIRAVGCPLATTSANLSGVEPPRTLAAVDSALRSRIIALDSACEGTGSASTVIDFSASSPRVLRS